ncbi:MAG: DUF805 domain-containing protein [Actinobacteria bacterium]|nr:DUF805 domain-containing protein [Actinomycetota bacterium]
MTFFESIKTVFRKYAEFGGRASRSEFWWFALFSALVSMALSALNIRTGGAYGFDYGDGTYGFGAMRDLMSNTILLGSSLSGLWSIAVLLPSLAVTVRRLRDAGRRWTELFWVLLPIAGIIVLIVHLCDRSVGEPAPAVAPAS